MASIDHLTKGSEQMDALLHGDNTDAAPEPAGAAKSSSAVGRRIGLVSCVKQKAAAARPARDLYLSDYFAKMRRYVEASCDDWRILSALHGLVHPEQVLAPYEQTLKGTGRRARREWADRVVSQIRTAFPNAQVIVFEIHAGAEYSDELVPRLRAAGYRVENPAAGLRIGERKRWYLENSSGRPAPSPEPERPDEAALAGSAHSVEVGLHRSESQPPSISQPSPRAQHGTAGRPTSADFERELLALLDTAAREGRSFTDIRAGALHQRVGGYPARNHAMPTCCHVMRRTMKPADQVLDEPPSGKGARLLIRYQLPR